MCEMCKTKSMQMYFMEINDGDHGKVMPDGEFPFGVRCKLEE